VQGRHGAPCRRAHGIDAPQRRRPGECDTPAKSAARALRKIIPRGGRGFYAGGARRPVFDAPVDT